MPLLGYIALLVGSSLVGGLTSAIMGFLVTELSKGGVLVLKNGVLLDVGMFGMAGAIIGGVLGVCEIMVAEGVGSHMTDEAWVGGYTIRYSDKIVEENWFEYVSFFSTFGFIIVHIWAYNMEDKGPGAFASFFFCIALAVGGALLVFLSVRKLSKLFQL